LALRECGDATPRERGDGKGGAAFGSLSYWRQGVHSPIDVLESGLLRMPIRLISNRISGWSPFRKPRNPQDPRRIAA